jgi:hypothetical protein
MLVSTTISWWVSAWNTATSAVQVRGDLKFGAQLCRGVTRRLQAEIQAGGAIGAVGQLGAQRCLKPLTIGGIQVQPGKRLECQARHWRRGAVSDRATAVRIGRGDEVIVRLKLHIAVPDPRHE